MLKSYSSKNSKDLPLLILLHGFLGNAKDWERHIVYWQNYFHCIAIDLPGHGDSLFSKIIALEKMSNFCDVADAIIKTIPNKKFHILGYSMGGRIAFDIRKRYSEMVNKCICISSSPGIEEPQEANLRFNKDQKLLTIHKKTIFLDMWYQQNLFIGIPQNKNYDGLILQRLLGNFKEMQQGLNIMSVGRQPNMWPWILNNRDEEILYICGEHDKKYLNIGHRLASYNSRIKLQIFNNCSHMPHFQEQEFFEKSIVNFLTRVV